MKIQIFVNVAKLNLLKREIINIVLVVVLLHMLILELTDMKGNMLKLILQIGKKN